MHAYLYHKLISGKLGEYFVQTSSGDQTILVHKEYPTLDAYEGPAGKFTRGHFDMAIIDPVHASESTWKGGIKENQRRHTLKVAIEISLNEIGDKRHHLEHFDKDFERLTGHKNKLERGYLLFFVRREDFARSGMLPIIAQLPDRLQLKFVENRDRTTKLAIIYTESRTPEPGLRRVIPVDRSSWIGS